MSDSQSKIHQNLKPILKIVAAISTISVAAQLTIDIGSIPITGQTLAILCWAFFLDPKESFVALISYLIIGFCGVPVFADGSFGLEKIYGGSGGYLIGFMVAAVLISYLKNQFKTSSFTVIVTLTFLGTLIILALGTSRLIYLYGVEKGLDYGFFPFWKGALIKIVIGTIIVWGVKQIIDVKKHSVAPRT